LYQYEEKYWNVSEPTNNPEIVQRKNFSEGESSIPLQFSFFRLFEHICKH
jgi:hypothetical protein